MVILILQSEPNSTATIQDNLLAPQMIAMYTFLVTTALQS